MKCIDLSSLILISSNSIDFTWSSVFEPGLKYFATVKACNPGGLCNSVSSNGVIMDDSPPIPGLVHVGSSGFHEPFIPHKYVYHPCFYKVG